MRERARIIQVDRRAPVHSIQMLGWGAVECRVLWRASESARLRGGWAVARDEHGEQDEAGGESGCARPRDIRRNLHLMSTVKLPYYRNASSFQAAKDERKTSL